jgi:hypothetical protein
MNAMPPMHFDKPVSVTFTLSAGEWNLVIEALKRAPYYIAAPMFAEIHEQVQRMPLDAAPIDGGEIWQPGPQ